MKTISVENQNEEPRFTYDDAFLDMLEKRRDDFLKNQHKGFTVEESMEYIKNRMQRKPRYQ